MKHYYETKAQKGVAFINCLIFGLVDKPHLTGVLVDKPAVIGALVVVSAIAMG